MNSYPGVVVTKLEGRLGARELDAFCEEIHQLLNQDQTQIVVDLSGVESLDSSAIEVLLRCVAQVVRADGELKLAALSPCAESILAVTRVSRFFEIFPTSDSAVASFDLTPLNNGAEPWNAPPDAERPDATKLGLSEA
jgi:anti-sigma B factor antagonist